MLIQHPERPFFHTLLERIKTMGSRGPLPKPDDQRINRKPRPQLRVVENKKVPQPALSTDRVWPQRTRDWWEMWGESPLTDDFTASEWSDLEDTALLHAVVWSATPGSPSFFKAMAQLRTRTAAFGATPSDRARLRIQFAFAEEAEAKVEQRQAVPEQPQDGARQRRGPFSG